MGCSLSQHAIPFRGCHFVTVAWDSSFPDNLRRNSLPTGFHPGNKAGFGKKKFWKSWQFPKIFLTLSGTQNSVSILFNPHRILGCHGHGVLWWLNWNYYRRQKSMNTKYNRNIFCIRAFLHKAATAIATKTWIFIKLAVIRTHRMGDVWRVIYD